MKRIIGWLKADPIFALFSLSILGIVVGVWVGILMLIARAMGL